MIERKFIFKNLREFKVKEYVREQVKSAGVSEVKVQKTPLGEKITIVTPRPGLIVGRKGQNIRLLTENLKKKFEMENPKIEIEEVKDINLDPNVVADKISNSLEKYGINRFKAIGHKAMDATMRSGALGVEILISGKVPSSRARTWRFYSGYMKKSGQFNKEGISKSITFAKLKTGVVGIKVKIMQSNIKLPDSIKIREVPLEIVKNIEEIKKKPIQKKKAKKTRSKRTVSSSKKTTKKKEIKKDIKKAETVKAETVKAETVKAEIVKAETVKVEVTKKATVKDDEKNKQKE